MSELLLPTGSTGVPLELHVARPGSGGIGSLTPVVQIRDGTTGDSYLDFADNTFKTSGWTTKQSSLTAVPGEAGRYRFTWNSSLAAAIIDGFRAIAEYIVTGTNAFIAHDVLIFRTEAAGGGGPTAGQIADAVWDEAISGHLSAGSTGEALDSASAGGDPSAIADAVWDEAISGHLSAGSTGLALNSAGASQGDGSVTVDTDYGGADNLRYQTSLGAGIDNAIVRAFLTSDWNANNKSDAFVKARVVTNVLGDFALPMFLDPGAYTLVYEKQGPPGQGYGPDTKALTVT